MKKVLFAVLVLITISGCKKETINENVIDSSKNPQLISVSVGNSTSEIVRVK